MNEIDRELAEAWFRKAEHDLHGVRIMLADPDPPADVVCFHCQQGAEKYLKGLLAWHGQRLAKTHDLIALLTIAAGVAPSLTTVRDQCELLADYAVEVRYPDPLTEPTLDDARAAKHASAAIRAAVRISLGIDA